MIITISGTPGSGKSTITKNLEKLFENSQRIYVGGIRRGMARKRGMNLEDFNQYAITHPETDVDVDERARDEARKLEKHGKVVIVEGRTQYHFLPESIKLYIKVNPKEGARRIWLELQNKESGIQRNEGKYLAQGDVEKRIQVREEEDAARYMEFYKIDPRDESQYDFVLDTSEITAEEATEKVWWFVKENSK